MCEFWFCCVGVCVVLFLGLIFFLSDFSQEDEVLVGVAQQCSKVSADEDWEAEHWEAEHWEAGPREEEAIFETRDKFL